MNRRRLTNCSAKAIWLLVLAVVSVLAPVWADTYVCPMAKQAREHLKPCCAAAATALHTQASPGNPQVEPPCDCPKLSWSVDAADHARQIGIGSDHTVADIALPVSQLNLAAQADRTCKLLDWTGGKSGVPLWIRNQSIRC